MARAQVRRFRQHSALLHLLLSSQCQISGCRCDAVRLDLFSTTVVAILIRGMCHVGCLDQRQFKLLSLNNNARTCKSIDLGQFDRLLSVSGASFIILLSLTVHTSVVASYISIFALYFGTSGLIRSFAFTHLMLLVATIGIATPNSLLRLKRHWWSQAQPQELQSIGSVLVFDTPSVSKARTAKELAINRLFLCKIHVDEVELDDLNESPFESD